MAIHSMTGFGSAQVTLERREFLLEIKTVNHKYLKLISRFPETFNPIQFDLENLARESLLRGSVYLTIRETSSEEGESYQISKNSLKNYLKQIKALQKDLALTIPLSLGELIQLPGVIFSEDPTLSWEKGPKKTLWQAFQKTLKQVLEMRKKEGQKLAEELKDYTKKIQLFLGKIEKRLPTFLKEYREKLFQRIQLLTQEQSLSLDLDSLIRELAIYADKTDISEEIVRLKSHLEQFNNSLKKEGSIGRKLEFLTQEMLREANTMGSKITDIEALNHIVEIKSLVDKIKEQVQNIE